MEVTREVESKELQGMELWRLQCARNVMDCYGLAMEFAHKQGPFESLIRLTVDGMTSVRDEEDMKTFYAGAAALCRECALALAGEGDAEDRAGDFRIYAVVFDDMNSGGKPC